MGNKSSEWLVSKLADRPGSVLSLAIKDNMFNNAVALNGTSFYLLAQTINDPSFGETIKNFFNTPSDCIASIIMYPFAVPNTVEASNLMIGGVSQSSNGVDIKCSPIDRTKMSNLTRCFIAKVAPTAGYTSDDYWFYDYAPYTTVRMYLPYYGWIDLPTNEVMGKLVNVYYAIDWQTGTLMYYVTVGDGITDDEASTRILSKVTCKIGVQIPIGSTNFLEIRRNAIMQGVTVAASLAATALSGVPVWGQSPNMSTSTTTTTAENYSEAQARGDYKGARMRPVSSHTSTTNVNRTRVINYEPHNHTRETLNLIANASTTALNNYFGTASSEITRDVSLEQYATRTVHMVVYHPKFKVPTNFEKFYGRPCVRLCTIGEMKGFSTFTDVHLESISNATQAELNEIMGLLTSGVIITDLDPESTSTDTPVVLHSENETLNIHSENENPSEEEIIKLAKELTFSSDEL